MSRFPAFCIACRTGAAPRRLSRERRSSFDAEKRAFTHIVLGVVFGDSFHGNLGNPSLKSERWRSHTHSPRTLLLLYRSAPVTCGYVTGSTPLLCRSSVVVVVVLTPLCHLLYEYYQMGRDGVAVRQARRGGRHPQLRRRLRSGD